ncbi:MAG: MFS transporter [Myxococcota bacterium]
MGAVLTDHGWSPAATALWLAVIPAGRMVLLPLWARLADAVGAARVLMGSVVGSTACAAVLLGVDGPWLAVGTILAWSWARAPAGPIVDASSVDRLGTGYGRVRAVGSVAYLALCAVGGVLRDVWRPAPIALCVGLSVATLAISLPLAPRLDAAAPPPGPGAWRALVRHPVLAPLAAVSLLHGAAIATSDNLLAVHVEQLALPASVTGTGIALGVGVEVVVLGFGAPLLERVGARTLLLLAVASSIPRYALTAASTDPAVIAGAQSLHGLGFGAFWLASTGLFARHAPPGLRYSAQAMLPAAMFGAGPVLGLTVATAVLRAGATTAGAFGAACALAVTATLLLLAVLARLR